VTAIAEGLRRADYPTEQWSSPAMYSIYIIYYLVLTNEFCSTSSFVAGKRALASRSA